MWTEVLALVDASGPNCPVTRSSPVTPKNIIAVLEWMWRTKMPLKDTERYGDLPGMRALLSPAPDDASQRTKWRFNILRVVHDEWHGQLIGKTLEDEAMRLFGGGGGGAGGRPCPVADDSPVTAANVLALLEWLRDLRVPIDGNTRFGQVQNMGEILKPATEDNRGKMIMWMFNALRMAFHEWHDLLPTPSAKPTFEELGAILFA